MESFFFFFRIEEGGGIENTMRWRGPEVANYKTARTILDIERYVNLFISRRVACRLRPFSSLYTWAGFCIFTGAKANGIVDLQNKAENKML